MPLRDAQTIHVSDMFNNSVGTGLSNSVTKIVYNLLVYKLTFYVIEGKKLKKCLRLSIIFFFFFLLAKKSSVIQSYGTE